MKTLMIIMLLLVVSCRTVKKSSSEQSEISREELKAVFIERETKAEKLFYGDTLRGFIPNLDLSKGPVMIPISSTGIDQELTFTDSGVHVKTVARPVARSQLSKRELITDTTIKQEREIQSESSEKEIKSTGMPWWIWVLALAILAGYILYKLRRLIIPF